MRSKNALRNLIVSLVYEIFVLAMGLIVPRFIILSYGDSINGLTQTINRLLTLVNLLQAGAVGASIFQMLKPVAENDYETQSAIMYASKKFFDKIGAIYLSIVLICSVFFGFFLRDENLTVIEIILSFCVLAINGSLYFFFTSRYDIVFSSYQKKYLLSISSFAERIVYYLLLFLVIRGDLHFIFMYVALLCGGLVRVSVNTIFYRRLINGRIEKKPKNTNYKIKDRKFLMLSSIGDQTISAAPTVIVTTLINLASSSVFSVYSMVYISMQSLINSFHHAISAIFGNVVAVSDDNKIGRIFDILLYIFVMLGTLLASCSAYMFMDFIDLYSSGFTEGVYVQPVLACFIVAHIAIFSVRTVINFVSHSCGLFKLTCRASIACGAISLLVSIISTWLWGMPYVMVGVLLYNFSTTCVLVYFFKKEITWFKIDYKWLTRGVVITAFPVLSWCGRNYKMFSVNSWGSWFVTAVLYAIIMIILLLIYTFVFERKTLSSILEHIKVVFKSSKMRTKV